MVDLHSYSELIGFWAGILTTVSFAPQVVRTWRSGGDGLSWGMLTLYCVGIGLWLVYGLLRVSGPLIFANALTELQVLALLVMKIRKRSY